MEGVRFEDEDNQVSTIAIVKTAPTGILAWLIEKKFAKNAKVAEQILLYVSLLAVAVGIFAPFVLRSENHAITPEERVQLEMSTRGFRPGQ